MTIIAPVWLAERDMQLPFPPFLLAISIALFIIFLLGVMLGRLSNEFWFLISVAVIVLFSGGPYWPVQTAMATVILTNLEATVITIILPEWRAGVLSCYHALRWHRQHH